MMGWTVTGTDGEPVKDFSIAGVSQARQAAFNHLVADHRTGGILYRVKDGAKEIVCEIDTVSARFRAPGDGSGWKPICRKLVLMDDDEWIVVDAGLVDFQNVRAFAEICGVDMSAVIADEPMLFYGKTVPDPDGGYVYEFTEAQTPRSFPVWVFERRHTDG